MKRDSIFQENHRLLHYWTCTQYIITILAHVKKIKKIVSLHERVPIELIDKSYITKSIITNLPRQLKAKRGSGLLLLLEVSISDLICEHVQFNSTQLDFDRLNLIIGLDYF